MIGYTNAGGGGIKLKIVGGSTRPATSSENTAWIKTDSAITGYVISTTQPDTANEGVVWIKTADSGVVINVGRRNPVLLHLGTAQLYVGKKWTYVEGYVYTAGEWVQFASERIPTEYQEVEFLQSVGSYSSNNTGQYIDTGLLIKNTHYGIEAKFNVQSNTGTGSNFGVIFGTRVSSGNEEFNAMTYDGSQFRYWNKSIKLGIVRNTDQEFKLHVGNYELPAGTKGKIEKYEYTKQYPLTIFALNNSGTVYQYGRLILYYLKIYDNSDNLIADYIPCYRKSDREPGLWDSVGKRFLTNSGTGTFTVGANVA